MTKPNVICISIDSLRYDFTTLCERKQKTTPFLDEISENSTIFENAITPSTWTLPVHTSVFTGLYPPEHGVVSKYDALGETPTFAEILSNNGYETNSFYLNSWLDTGNILKGFNKQKPDRGAKKKIADSASEIHPILETILSKSYDIQKPVSVSLSLIRKWAFSDSGDGEGQKTINEAIDSIDNTNDPFCWFLHLNDAHWKYTPPAPYHEKFTKSSTFSLIYNAAWWQNRIYNSQRGRLYATAGKISPPNKHLEIFKDLYRGEIRYCDFLIESLVKELKECNKWSETILVVFGDHGDAFGEKGVFGHQFSTDESVIHVPLLIRDPTEKLPNERVSSPASLADIHPTILSLCDVDVDCPNSFDLSSEKRECAYCYYEAPAHILENEHYQNLQERLPSKKQHAAWISKEKSLRYDPESDGYTGNEELLPKIKSHTDGLVRSESVRQELNDEVASRLEDIGYLRE